MAECTYRLIQNGPEFRADPDVEATGIIAEVEREKEKITAYCREHGIDPSERSWTVSRSFGHSQDAFMADVVRLLIASGRYKVHTNPSITEAFPCLEVLPPHPYGSA